MGLSNSRLSKQYDKLNNIKTITTTTATTKTTAKTTAKTTTNIQSDPETIHKNVLKFIDTNKNSKKKS
uniref:Uncharacterized protein n=1 Tax=Mimivirus LCMiAC01 TaxID=2506608 RepID=A0A481Z072_9VIRU|nr:MAG: hypothetical protein LCMiAC01_05500 [Mimivirus LCMiAC01]